MNRLNLRLLRWQRLKRYWLDIAPYSRYVGSSALGFMLIIGFSFYGYGYFVHHLPDRFPAYALIALLMAIQLSSGSFRTYLREADVIFLLPMESYMSSYLNPSLRSAYIWHILTMTIIWQILWPLYQATYEHSMIAFFTIWIQLALMKGIVMLGVWQENQIQESRTRLIFTGLRPIVIGLLIYLTLTQSVAWAVLATGIVSIVYLLTLRTAATYTIHWERLIILEQRSRSRWITWFNLFVEMPRRHSSVRQTRILHRIARIITFKKSNAYRYLYLLTWIRSDLFHVVARLSGLGVFLLIVLSSVWIKLVLLVLFAYLIKLQLSELERYHKNVEVTSIYPVKQNQRSVSARLIAIYVHTAIMVLLLCSFLISYWIHS